MHFKRAIILVIDGFGIGSTPDAELFGDQGANTFAHLTQAYQRARNRPLALPNLCNLGLAAAVRAVSNETLAIESTDSIKGAYAASRELSSGKDTPTGHWEMTGVPVLFDWGYYPDQPDCFPKEFLSELIGRTGVAGVLGCCHASGTDIIRELGEEHQRSGKPICYTSADSVFQVAAHEKTFGLKQLYRFCEAARELLYAENIGRVIARPFVGDAADNFRRTGNRKDYSIEPPALTLLDLLQNDGRTVQAIGKVSDIFAHRGVSKSTKATGLQALLDKTLVEIKSGTDVSLIFTNLVNFDQDFGHRRDPIGYAEALQYLDRRLPEIQSTMTEEDLLVLTSDHGCDPTWKGTDHTREYVPTLLWYKGIGQIDLGIRTSFADLGQTLAEIFKLPAFEYGDSFHQALQTS